LFSSEGELESSITKVDPDKHSFELAGLQFGQLVPDQYFMSRSQQRLAEMPRAEGRPWTKIG